MTGQTYYQYKTDEARLVFFDKNLSRYIPHMMRMFQNGKAHHEQIWTTDSVYQPEAPLLLSPIGRTMVMEVRPRFPFR